MRLIDSHCHLDLAAFDSDRDEVLKLAQSNDITDVVVPAIQSATWQPLKTLSQQLFPVNLRVAYGLHPVFQDYHQPNDLVLLEQYLGDEAAIAVGECGLDFFIEDHDKQVQLQYFTEQLDLAIQFKLPVIIHSRKSLDLVIRELRLRPSLSGVVHSYSGSLQQAKQLIDLGFYLGFGGPITYPRATKLRGLVAELPLESLLLETDAPDQPAIGKHGERNEPGWLTEIAVCVAELRGISLEKVADATTENARRLFSF